MTDRDLYAPPAWWHDDDQDEPDELEVATGPPAWNGGYGPGLPTWAGLVPVDPDWMRDALCREHPGLNWFPGLGDPVDEVKAVCRRCLVQQECLDYALTTRVTDGIWGGTSGKERRQLRRMLDADD